ncbi:hypothetical protein BU15DRAFT_79040 [Melanogaster broomeanus]|nr:hypothetical protein BU15DRAFT_79040 [Melanogaster broomeanus]
MPFMRHCCVPTGLMTTSVFQGAICGTCQASLKGASEWVVDRLLSHSGKGSDAMFEVLWSTGDITWAPLREVRHLQVYDEYCEAMGMATGVPDDKKGTRTPPSNVVRTGHPAVSAKVARLQFIRGAGSYPGEPPAGYDEYKKREKYAPTPEEYRELIARTSANRFGESVDEVRMPAAAFKYALDAIASKPVIVQTHWQPQAPPAREPLPFGGSGGFRGRTRGGFAGRGGRSFGFRGSPAGQGGRGPFGATAAPRAFRGRLGLTGGGQHASARNNAANLQGVYDVLGEVLSDLTGLSDHLGGPRGPKRNHGPRNRPRRQQTDHVAPVTNTETVNYVDDVLVVHHDEQVTGDAMQGVEEDLPGLDDDDEEPILYDETGEAVQF